VERCDPPRTTPLATKRFGFDVCRPRKTKAPGAATSTGLLQPPPRAIPPPARCCDEWTRNWRPGGLGPGRYRRSGDGSGPRRVSGSVLKQPGSRIRFPFEVPNGPRHASPARGRQRGRLGRPFDPDRPRPRRSPLARARPRGPLPDGERDPRRSRRRRRAPAPPRRPVRTKYDGSNPTTLTTGDRRPRLLLGRRHGRPQHPRAAVAPLQLAPKRPQLRRRQRRPPCAAAPPPVPPGPDERTLPRPFRQLPPLHGQRPERRERMTHLHPPQLPGAAAAVRGPPAPFVRGTWPWRWRCTPVDCGRTGRPLVVRALVDPVPQFVPVLGASRWWAERTLWGSGAPRGILFSSLRRELRTLGCRRRKSTQGRWTQPPAGGQGGRTLVNPFFHRSMEAPSYNRVILPRNGHSVSKVSTSVSF
jgi:hypothetical protein